MLARAWAASAGPSDDPLTIDLDSTVCETYGLAKEGAQRHNHAGKRGYHPQRQLALWKAVQQAQAQGLRLRAIFRQLGVHCNTVRKYARSLTQPTHQPWRQPITSTSRQSLRLTNSLSI